MAFGDGDRFVDISEVIEVKFAAKKEKTPARYKIAIWHGPKSDLNQFQASLKGETKLPDLAALCKGGPPRWTAPVVNQGALGGAVSQERQGGSTPARCHGPRRDYCVCNRIARCRKLVARRTSQIGDHRD